MDGLLSNTWRDVLALIGAISPLRAIFVLLRRWFFKGQGRQIAWPRFGYLEMVKESEELPPDEKRVVRIAFGIGGAIMVGLCTASSYASTLNDSFFSEAVELWSWILMVMIAVGHEIGLFLTVTRYISSRVESNKHAASGAIFSLSLLALLFFSYWAVSAGAGSTHWVHRLFLSYATGYMITFGLMSLGEILWQVDEWKDNKKKRR